MNKNLPKFKITIDEEYSENGQSLGIDAIAFTKNPAIMVKGMAFNADVKKVFFADELKYRIAGPIMIPMEIYRCDDSEYYVQFTSEEIEKIHSKFMANMGKEVFNLEHNEDVKVPAYVLESILVDSENKQSMIKQEYGIDVPLGTSFLVSQVTDKQYYKDLVDNDQVGFSIEGFLGLKLSEIINNNKTNLNTMDKVNLLPGEYPTVDGKLLVVAEDGTFEIKEVVKEEMAEEIKKEEEVVKEEMSSEEEINTEEEVIKEEEMAEEVVTEEVVTEEKTVVESYSKEEVDAKFDELYKLIADMKAEEVSEEVVEEVKPLEMSIHDRFSAFVNFSKQS